jgi:hypothetical protein
MQARALMWLHVMWPHVMWLHVMWLQGWVQVPWCFVVAASFFAYPLPFLSLFLSRSWQGEPAEVPFQMGSEKMVIKCFKQKCKGGDKIATAYMEVA